MRVLLAAWVALLPLGAAGQDAPDGGARDPYAAWIDRLADDDPSAREEAAAHLRRAGRAAWPALEAATRSTDPETAARARDLLASIRLRRRLSFRILDSFPAAEAALRDGHPAARAALARAMSGHLEESRDFLAELLADADPETALAAAEALYDGRAVESVPRLLDLLTSDAPPRPRRIIEMLSSTRSALDAPDLEKRFRAADPRARARLMELSAGAQVAFAVDARDVLDLLDEPRTRGAVIEWTVAWNRREFAVPLEEKLVPGAPDAGDILLGLRRLGHAAATQRIAPFLRHDDESIREQALQALPDDGDAASDALVTGLLDDPSSAIRQRAISALIRRRGDKAFDALWAFHLAQDGDPRDTAAFLLCRFRDRTAPLAAKLLRDPDPDHRLRGADLLVRLEGVGAVAELASDPEERVRRWVLGKALATSEESAGVLVRRLTADAAPSIRFDATRALARTGRREDVEALVPWLESGEFSFRYPAAEAYLRHNGEKSRDLVARMLDDREPAFQCLAIAALQDRASPEASARAVRFLSDADASLRRAAGAYLVQSVGSTRDPEIVAQVTKLLDSLDGETLTQAASIVTSHGGATEAPAVKRLLAGGRAPSEGRALDALARWEGAGALLDCVTDERAHGVLERVADSLRARPADAQAAAAIGRRLGELAAGSVRVRRAVARWVADIAPPGGAGIAVALLDDPDAGVRYAAIRSARRLGASITPRLLAMMDDEDPEVRLAAAMAYSEVEPQDRAAIDAAAAREECAWVRRRLGR